MQASAYAANAEASVSPTDAEKYVDLSALTLPFFDAGAGTRAPAPEVGHARSLISTAASSITLISLLDE